MSPALAGLMAAFEGLADSMRHLLRLFCDIVADPPQTTRHRTKRVRRANASTPTVEVSPQGVGLVAAYGGQHPTPTPKPSDHRREGDPGRSHDGPGAPSSVLRP